MPGSSDVWGREVLPDWPEACEQRLRSTRIPKAAHPAFAPAGQLVAVFGTAVQCSLQRRDRLVGANATRLTLTPAGRTGRQGF